METLSALLALCAGNSPVIGEFPTQRPVTRSFDVFFDLNKLLSKQWWGWWFETPSRPLLRRCNAFNHTSSSRHDGFGCCAPVLLISEILSRCIYLANFLGVPHSCPLISRQCHLCTRPLKNLELFWHLFLCCFSGFCTIAWHKRRLCVFSSAAEIS